MVYNRILFTDYKKTKQKHCAEQPGQEALVGNEKQNARKQVHMSCFSYKMSLTPLKPLNEKANYFNSAFISVTTIPKQNPEVFNRSTLTSKRARYLYLLCLSGFYSGTTATPTGG